MPSEKEIYHKTNHFLVRQSRLLKNKNKTLPYVELKFGSINLNSLVLLLLPFGATCQKISFHFYNAGIKNCSCVSPSPTLQTSLLQSKHSVSSTALHVAEFFETHLRNSCNDNLKKLPSLHAILSLISTEILG